MNKERPARRQGRWLCLALACAAAGCGKDADCLARVGKKSAAKVEAMTGGARARLSDGWQAVRGSVGEATLNSRVAVRLRWDKDLAGADLHVHSPRPGVIRLEGTVADLPQRQRAVALARSTQGVENVEDLLTLPGEAGKPR
jgi:osmotically-inducible protein OsmY